MPSCELAVVVLAALGLYDFTQSTRAKRLFTTARVVMVLVLLWCVNEARPYNQATSSHPQGPTSSSSACDCCPSSPCSSCSCSADSIECAGHAVAHRPRHRRRVPAALLRAHGRVPKADHNRLRADPLPPNEPGRGALPGLRRALSQLGHRVRDQRAQRPRPSLTPHHSRTSSRTNSTPASPPATSSS